MSPYRIARCAALLVLVLALLAQPATAAEFTDLASGHWAYADITELMQQGIVNGYPDGSFMPDAPVATGEFYKLMCMAIDPGYVAQGELRPYAEAASLPDPHWAYEYALRLVRLCGPDRVPQTGFFGAAVMSRTMARIDMALLAAAVHSTRAGIALPTADSALLNRFSDLGNLSLGQQTALSYCVSQGLISGFEDGTFRPLEGLTRAQAAKMTVAVAGGFSTLSTGALAEQMRTLRTLLPIEVRNCGLTEPQYGLCLEALAEYLAWYPQPIIDALAATGCSILITPGEGNRFEGRLLTLSVDSSLLGSQSGRRQAARLLRDGFNYMAGNLMTTRLAAGSQISLSHPISFYKLAEVAELSLLAWDENGTPVGPVYAQTVGQLGESGRQQLLELEAATLLLANLYRLNEADRAKINPFGPGHPFTVTAE